MNETQSPQEQPTEEIRGGALGENVIPAILFRVRDKPAWYYEPDTQLTDARYWVTPFTYEQMEGNRNHIKEMCKSVLALKFSLKNYACDLEKGIHARDEELARMDKLVSACETMRAHYSASLDFRPPYVDLILRALDGLGSGTLAGQEPVGYRKLQTRAG